MIVLWLQDSTLFTYIQWNGPVLAVSCPTVQSAASSVRCPNRGEQPLPGCQVSWPTCLCNAFTLVAALQTSHIQVHLVFVSQPPALLCSEAVCPNLAHTPQVSQFKVTGPGHKACHNNKSKVKQATTDGSHSLGQHGLLSSRNTLLGMHRHACITANQAGHATPTQKQFKHSQQHQLTACAWCMVL